MAGLPTTAGCPAFAYEPGRVGARWSTGSRAAGAVVVGKTNLDQFATGLVGTRSPYGAVREPAGARPRQRRLVERLGRRRGPRRGRPRPRHRHRRLGPGARRLLRHRRAEADAAAGCRPAASCPRAARSTACRCSPATCAGRGRAVEVAAGLRRRRPVVAPAPAVGAGAGPPRSACRRRRRAGAQWCDAGGGRRLRRRSTSTGFEVVEVDLDAVPRRRRPALRRRLRGRALRRRRCLRRRPPRRRRPRRSAAIIAAAGAIPAHRPRRRPRPAGRPAPPGRRRVGRRSTPSWCRPRPIHPTLAEVAADPVGVNAALGRFTNGCQPARLVRGRRARRHRAPTACRSASPCSARPGPTGRCGRRPRRIAGQAAAAARRPTTRIAPRRVRRPPRGPAAQPPARPTAARRLVARTTTAPAYRMSALATDPPKPGRGPGRRRAAAPRSRSRCGRSTPPAFGTFVAEVPAPLAIGTVELADGTCGQRLPVRAARRRRAPTDITDHGGWRAWLATGERERSRSVEPGGASPPCRTTPAGSATGWSGVPPSGPMDDLSFRLANRAVGNRADAAGLECTASGPDAPLHRGRPSSASAAPTMDGRRSTAGRCRAGSRSRCGAGAGAAARPAARRRAAHLRRRARRASTCPWCSAAGRPSPSAASAATRAGRWRPATCCAVGDLTSDRLAPSPVPPACWPDASTARGASACSRARTPRPSSSRPPTSTPSSPPSWRVQVPLRPHRASASTGPKPAWARPDGGEAGLHPSNIHDTGYAFGTVDFTGDTPVVLGPDGPSLGGFTCPATVVAAERWKLGQLAPGDAVRFVPARRRPGRRARPAPDHDASRTLRAAGPRAAAHRPTRRRRRRARPLARRRATGPRSPSAGPATPSCSSSTARCRWTSPCGPGSTPSTRWLADHGADADRRRHRRASASLLVQLDPTPARAAEVVELRAAGRRRAAGHRRARHRRPHRPPPAVVGGPGHPRGDPALHGGGARRRARGARRTSSSSAGSTASTRSTTSTGSCSTRRYLVLGLGDVYLGAPVATPLDPRHRLVTTKYNPARTWTPENAVGIGGAYLCVYGMEGPGGYQFVGRTVPVWYLDVPTPGDEPDVPWLLRSLRPDPLPPRRAPTSCSTCGRQAKAGELDDRRSSRRRSASADHLAFLDAEADGIAAFRDRPAGRLRRRARPLAGQRRAR